MNTTQDPYLRAAGQAIQVGELDKARSILAALLSQDQKNVEAWFLLSAAVEQPPAIAGCLRQVLRLAPDHAGALMVRSRLEQEWHLPPLPVMQVAATSAALKHPCPFCTSPIQVMEEVVACPQCQTYHHYSCWQENGHCCGALLCQGFSLSELASQPLPIQPAPTDRPLVVIRKEDIGRARKVSRKEQEQSFQRYLLMLALLQEEGELPAQLASALPSIDELIDQIQRDRSTGKTAAPPAAPPPPAQPTPPVRSTPALPPAYQHSSVVTGTMSIWAPPAQANATAQTTASSVSPSCIQCGYALPAVRPAFCPRCGAAQV